MTSYYTVGVDGSRAAAAALDWAARSAAASGHRLEIVHALPNAGRTDVYGRSLSPLPVAALERYGRDLVESAQRRAEEISPGLSTWARVEIGSAVSVLEQASKGADALVVGRRGAEATAAFVGSVPLKIATAAHCPVFVIPEGSSVATTGPVVVGVDDSEFSLAALRFALQEAGRRRAAVRVVTGYQVPMLTVPVEPQVMTDLEQGAGEAAYATIAKALQAATDADTGAVSTESVAVRTTPSAAILENSGDAQLVVIGSHGRGFVRRLLLGSVGQHILDGADRPVAVVNADH